LRRGRRVDAGVVCKKYEEPESCGCAADFLLGEEMKGDPSGREELEAAAMKINDSNKVNAFLLQ
jgi:hypothetical protein